MCPLLAGCAFHRQYTYKPLKWQVEQEGVLRITAFPADYADWDFHVPFVLLISDGTKQLNLQLYLYLRNNTGTSDNGMGACTITEFSYQLPRSERVNLIDDSNPWRGHYWAVHRLEGEKPDPLPYLKGQSVDVRVKLELNGEPYVFEGRMKASSRMGLPMPIFWVYSSI